MPDIGKPLDLVLDFHTLRAWQTSPPTSSAHSSPTSANCRPRRAKPGEEYANCDSAMVPGEMFDGVQLRNGRSVDDILAEARKRNLTAVFSLIRTDKKTGGLSFEPLPADRVGPGWIVWNAWQMKAGVIRLLVTPERLPENPFYNGSAPPPAS
ncbi:hypothetical protein ACTWPT_33575 [Nonomuraea sp. 3N208]|uniref:hypothetical protein n=1 Tax=Nonomuraea sp. 3N208 TaxID=3457421 RepID=UPI003FD3694B